MIESAWFLVFLMIVTLIAVNATRPLPPRAKDVQLVQVSSEPEPPPKRKKNWLVRFVFASLLFALALGLLLPDVGGRSAGATRSSREIQAERQRQIEAASFLASDAETAR